MTPLPVWDGIIIPGGFGSRGTEGMILAANYARENKIPFLGICLGMQMAMVAFSEKMFWDMRDATARN